MNTYEDYLKTNTYLIFLNIYEIILCMIKNICTCKELIN